MTQNGPGSRLADWGIQSLTDRVHLQHARPSPGVTWARKIHVKPMPAKEEARNRVLEWSPPDELPALSLLTMPGMQWRFEHGLFRQRGVPGREGSAKTSITAIERDEGVYRGSLRYMPGRKLGFTAHSTPSFGTSRLSTPYIEDYVRCSFEDLALASTYVFDAAWLDFNGPINLTRLRAIKHFWQRQIGLRLVVTCATARWHRDTVTAITPYSTFQAWFLSHFEDADVRDVHRYADGFPMIQFVLDKV